MGIARALRGRENPVTGSMAVTDVLARNTFRVGDVVVVAWLRGQAALFAKSRLSLRLGLRWDGSNGHRRCRFGTHYRRPHRLARLGHKRAVWSFSILFGRVIRVAPALFPQLTLCCRIRRVCVTARFCLSAPNVLQVLRVRKAPLFSRQYKKRRFLQEFRTRQERLFPLRRMHRRKRKQ